MKFTDRAIRLVGSSVDWIKRLRGSFAPPRRIAVLLCIMEVHVSGRYAYVADEESGLRVIDISDPAALPPIYS